MEYKKNIGKKVSGNVVEGSGNFGQGVNNISRTSQGVHC
jgi:hypothetical protein